MVSSTALVVCAAVLFQAIIAVHAFPGSESVRLIGRWNTHGQANWPMSGFEIMLQAADDDVNDPPAPSLIVEFDQCEACQYVVETFADNISQGRSTINPTSLTLTIQLPALTQSVRVLKVTEADIGASDGGTLGVMSIASVKTTAPAVAAEGRKSSASSDKATKLKLLVFGDSLTCGYGVLGTGPCDFTASTESSTASWAGVTAKELQAELSQVTWSGKGVVRNYGDVQQTSDYPLPFYYNRTLGFNPTDKGFAGDDLYWDPLNYQPDLLLVLLGSNDYSTNPVPETSEFVSGYSALVQQMKRDYPHAKIVLLCAPDQSSSAKCPNVKTTASQNKVHFLQIQPTDPVAWGGCSGHPTVTQQKQMAELSVLPFLKTLLA